MITDNISHKERVRSELAKAGMTSYGLMKSSSRYLHNVIHNHEHIFAVAYGRYEGGSGILVGTEKRIIFLDHKPGFTVSDEIGLDIVTGIKSAHTGPFSSITLHTKVGDYQLRYVNHLCAQKFVRYIETRGETRRVEAATPSWISDETIYQVAMAMTPEAMAFLTAHDTAVLSTEDRRGNLYGTAVYYLVGQNIKIYILTRSDTAKARNILSHQQVALTIYEPDPARTLQIQGIAHIETNQKTKDEIFSQMIQPRQYRGGVLPPPVTTLKEGAYVVISITPTSATYHPYQGAEEK